MGRCWVGGNDCGVHAFELSKDTGREKLYSEENLFCEVGEKVSGFRVMVCRCGSRVVMVLSVSVLGDFAGHGLGGCG